MSAPGADETSVFIVQPDGWYGLLSLRSPFDRRRTVFAGAAHVPDWDDWLRRLIGTGAVERISCLAGIAAWVGALFLDDPLPNRYADVMLETLAANGKPTFSTVVFTGWEFSNGTTIGLNNDQMGSIAAGYRMAQQRWLD